MTLNQYGLLIDIIGVLILFKFGLPSAFNENAGKVFLTIEDKSEEEIGKEDRKNRFIKIMSYVGLILILAGFLLQFIGSF